LPLSSGILVQFVPKRRLFFSLAVLFSREPPFFTLSSSVVSFRVVGLPHDSVVSSEHDAVTFMQRFALLSPPSWSLSQGSVSAFFGGFGVFLKPFFFPHLAGHNSGGGVQSHFIFFGRFLPRSYMRQAVSRTVFSESDRSGGIVYPLFFSLLPGECYPIDFLGVLTHISLGILSSLTFFQAEVRFFFKI